MAGGEQVDRGGAALGERAEPRGRAPCVGPIEMTFGRGGVVSRRMTSGTVTLRPCRRRVMRMRYEPSGARPPSSVRPSHTKLVGVYAAMVRSSASTRTSSPSWLTTDTVTSSVSLSLKFTWARSLRPSRLGENSGVRLNCCTTDGRVLEALCEEEGAERRDHEHAEDRRRQAVHKVTSAALRDLAAAGRLVAGERGEHQADDAAMADDQRRQLGGHRPQVGQRGVHTFGLLTEGLAAGIAGMPGPSAGSARSPRGPRRAPRRRSGRSNRRCRSRRSGRPRAA